MEQAEVSLQFQKVNIETKIFLHIRKHTFIHSSSEAILIYFQNVLTESIVGPEHTTCAIQYLIFSDHEYKYEI